jgi:hypothetical protein
MLQVALKIHSAIDTYTKDWLSELADDWLSIPDWSLLKDIEEFLQPFHEVTLKAQGIYGTLDRVLWTMDILVRHFEFALEKHKNRPLAPYIDRSWDVFNKYYSRTDDSSVYAAALVLHPSYRSQYIQKNWEYKWRKPAMDSIKQLWSKYQNLKVVDQEPPSIEKLKSHNIFEKIAEQMDVVNARFDEDELSLFCREKPINISKSALDWWLEEEHCKAYPNLSQLAIDILSVPAMSDAPERVFSGTRRTISWERCRMGPQMIERTQCLKSWIKAKIVNTDEIDEIDLDVALKGEEGEEGETDKAD